MAYLLVGVAGDFNSTGDEQKKLDVLSNEMFVNSLYNSHACAILVSEENEDPIIVPEHMAGMNKAFWHSLQCFHIFATFEHLLLILRHVLVAVLFFSLTYHLPLTVPSVCFHLVSSLPQASTVWPSILLMVPPTLTAMCLLALFLLCGRRYAVLLYSLLLYVLSP